ncbi:hypothetical protein MetMK1DRAFT_00018250 [Metallosphaera yellowstonensis MK1]|jgi:hypothetical protein|uniref:Uncharacterized protein n=1 Tax=Metallosphaera yellowstonensis MK1 TaxID=671065 RepID=H2C5K2_9CREN|nr:hypothetical protein [Metallosphaera yellowstonensis]EHP69079.1 hypothetical protein MetMK1DRAFT_00018250 [Metallosphaera yellowstonensis MK1]
MGLFKKEKVYPKQVDPSLIGSKFSQFLTQDGWKVQTKDEGSKVLVQAQKGGILRDLIVADRALNFLFEKVPEGMKVTVGVGKWVQNLAIATIEILLVSELFLFVDVPEMLWTSHVENQLMKKLDEIVESS